MAGRQAILGRCFFTAWIFAWVAAIYVPSALIAWLELSPLAQGSGLGGTLAVADEVAPPAKLAFGIIFGLLALVARVIPAPEGPARIGADMALAAATMAFTLALLPEGWSRGFGVALSGERFAPDLTAIYLGSALLAGFVFSAAQARCRARPARRQD